MKKLHFKEKVNSVNQSSQLNITNVLLVIIVFAVMYLITEIYNIRFQSIDYDYQLRLLNGVYETLKEEKIYAEKILDEFYYEELYYANVDNAFDNIDKSKLIEYLSTHISAYIDYERMFVITKDRKMYVSSENDLKNIDFIKKYDDMLESYFTGDEEYIYIEKNDKVYSDKQILKKYLNANGEVICLIGIDFNHKMVINSLEKYRSLFYPKSILIEDNLNKIFFTADGHDNVSNSELTKFNKLVEKLDQIPNREEMNADELFDLLNDSNLKSIVNLGNNKKVYTFSDSSWTYTKDLKLKIGIINSNNYILDLINSMYYGQIAFIIFKMIVAILIIKYIFLDNDRNNYLKPFLIIGCMIILQVIVYNIYLNDYGYVKNVKNAFNSSFMVEKIALNEHEKKQITNFIYNEERGNISSAEYFNYDSNKDIEPSEVTKGILKKRKKIVSYNIKIIKPGNVVLMDSDDLIIDNNYQLTEEYLRNFRLEDDYRMVVDLKLTNTVLYEVNELFDTLNKLPSRFKSFNTNETNDKLADLYISNDVKNIRIEDDKYKVIDRIPNITKTNFEYDDIVIYVDEENKTSNISIYIDSDDTSKKKVVYTYYFTNYMEGIWVLNVLSIIICLIYFVLVIMLCKKSLKEKNDKKLLDDYDRKQMLISDDNKRMERLQDIQIYDNYSEENDDKEMNGVKEMQNDIFKVESQENDKDDNENGNENGNDNEKRNDTSTKHTSIVEEYDQDNLISANDYAKFEEQIKNNNQK